MAHVIKDSMNHYAIEIKRGPKHVQCLVRLSGEVEYKSFPLTKLITDHEYNSNDGTYQFDQRWQPCTLEQDAGCTLERVIESFESSELPVTDKARRMLEALRTNPEATEPRPLDEPSPELVESIKQRVKPTNGDKSMSTKTKKASAPKPKKEKTEKGYKGHRAGSRKEAAHKFLDEKKPDRQAFIKYCEGKGLSPATASSWFGAMHKKAG